MVELRRWDPDAALAVATRRVEERTGRESTATGFPVWHMAVNTRSGVGYISARRWRALTRDIDLRRFIAAKNAHDEDYLAGMAQDIRTCMESLGLRPDIVAAPPQSTSLPHHFATELARLVGGVDQSDLFESRKRANATSHHPRKVLDKPPITMLPEAGNLEAHLLIVDDIATSGATICEALRVARPFFKSAIAIAWVYGVVVQ